MLELTQDNISSVLENVKKKLAEVSDNATSPNYAYVSPDFQEVWIDYEKKRFKDDYISKAPEGRLSCSIYLLFIEERLEEYMKKII